MEHFARLASLIATQVKYRLAVTGGKGEEELVRKIGDAGKTDLTFAGSLSLPELAALLAEARVVVGSRPGHCTSLQRLARALSGSIHKSLS